MSSQKKTITIMIVDDHPGWIEGVRTIIHKASDMQIVGEVQDVEAIKQKIAELQPDILLLDLVMPNHNPAELEKWVREKYPDVVTLVLTAHDRDAYLAGMMEAGAAGYLDKKMKANDLLDAIRRAARGEFLYERNKWSGRNGGEKRWAENGTVCQAVSAKFYNCLQKALTTTALRLL
jgi:DNA-binding NarL/FixJ family response regulator